MAIKQPLFQQNDTTDQSADVARMFINDLFNGRTGIMAEDSMKVIQRAAGANNSVDIGSGSVLIPGTQSGSQGTYYIRNEGVVNLPMSTAAHGSLPRIDTVFVRVRDSFYSGVDNDAEFLYQAGTAASSPVAPDLNALGFTNHLRLATINVPANDNTITTADITDVRVTFGGRATAIGGAWVSSNAPSLPRLGQLWYDTSAVTLKINTGSSSSPIWSNIVELDAWTTFTPTFGGITLGGGSLNGRYTKIGRLVIVNFGFQLGSSGNVTGLISWTPPSAIPIISLSSTTCVGIAWAEAGPGTIRYGGVGIKAISDTNISRFVSDGDNVGWQATIPVNWEPGNALYGCGIYETTS
jgi:hypothetical protein